MMAATAPATTKPPKNPVFGRSNEIPKLISASAPQATPHGHAPLPSTNCAETVPATDRVAYMVSRVYRECDNGAPGPSCLEIPRDVMERKIPLEGARIPEAGHYRAAQDPGLPFSSGEVILTHLIQDEKLASREEAKARVRAMRPEDLASYLRAMSPSVVLSAYEESGMGGMYSLPKLLRDGAVLPKGDPITALREVHERTHPAAGLRRKRKAEDGTLS